MTFLVELVSPVGTVGTVVVTADPAAFESLAAATGLSVGRSAAAADAVVHIEHAGLGNFVLDYFAGVGAGVVVGSGGGGVRVEAAVGTAGEDYPSAPHLLAGSCYKGGEG